MGQLQAVGTQGKAPNMRLKYVGSRDCFMAGGGPRAESKCGWCGKPGAAWARPALQGEEAGFLPDPCGLGCCSHLAVSSPPLSTAHRCLHPAAEGAGARLMGRCLQASPLPLTQEGLHPPQKS